MITLLTWGGIGVLLLALGWGWREITFLWDCVDLAQRERDAMKHDIQGLQARVETLTMRLHKEPKRAPFTDGV